MGEDGAVLIMTGMRECEVRWGTLGKNLEKKQWQKTVWKENHGEKNKGKSESHISFTTISIHMYFLSVSHHTSFFPLFFSHCFFPPLSFFQIFFPCFPPNLTLSHPSQHCPISSHPYLSKVLCRLFCVFAWRSASSSAVKLLVAKHKKCPLKGHLRALPTEIISPAKWRSNRKWRPTNGPADRLATKFPKISSFWWVLQWAAATTGPGNMSLRASAPSTENIVRSRFFRLLWSWWMIGRQGRPVDSTRRMEAYGTSRNVESFYLGAGLTTCWIMEAEETTRQSQVRLRRSG